jgi:hypothetical protein
MYPCFSGWGAQQTQPTLHTLVCALSAALPWVLWLLRCESQRDQNTKHDQGRWFYRLYAREQSSRTDYLAVILCPGASKCALCPGASKCALCSCYSELSESAHGVPYQEYPDSFVLYIVPPGPEEAAYRNKPYPSGHRQQLPACRAG